MREASSTFRRQIDYLIWGILFLLGAGLRLLGRDTDLFHLEMSTVDTRTLTGNERLARPRLPQFLFATADKVNINEAVECPLLAVRPEGADHERKGFHRESCRLIRQLTSGWAG